ncbi:MAG: MBL fold metallo-hydrolase [Actinomycetota bacterium]
MAYGNRYPASPPTTEGGGLLRWQWERRKTAERRAPRVPILGVEPDLDRVHRGDGVRATWVGHATVLLQVAGMNVLTDPHFGRVASPLPIGPRRHQPPGLPFDALPRIDVVLVSHNHYDHLDRGTVRALMRRDAPTFLVPEGVDRWFARAVPGTVLAGPDRNVIGLTWDREHAIGDVRFRFLAVQHWSARALRDRNHTLWGSWAVLAPGLTFWFSGDLGYSKDILDVHESIGDVDVAAISIGAYDPRWIMRDSHLDPGEAVTVLEDLRARSAIAVHWGTFEDMTDEPLDEPPVLLREHLARRGIAEERFLVPRHGETLAWDGARLR